VKLYVIWINFYEKIAKPKQLKFWTFEIFKVFFSKNVEDLGFEAFFQLGLHCAQQPVWPIDYS